MITHSTFKSPLGNLTLAANEAVLCALCFQEHWEADLERLRRQTGAGDIKVGRIPPTIEGCLEAYFGGELDALDAIPIDPRGTPFQKKVWTMLRKVPAQTTISYSGLAKASGCPGAARAVGTANAVNPICLVIPCHRVIRADGSIGEYGGSVERKKWLLMHEGALVKESATDAGRGPWWESRTLVKA